MRVIATVISTSAAMSMWRLTWTGRKEVKMSTVAWPRTDLAPGQEREDREADARLDQFEVARHRSQAGPDQGTAGDRNHGNDGE